ncbi:MAG: hypothetical protein KJ749_14815, partial [Planctomycetes bacterium]|nr:hypothetical protein [Planctomycetota bacterium]
MRTFATRTFTRSTKPETCVGVDALAEVLRRFEGEPVRASLESTTSSQPVYVEVCGLQVLGKLPGAHTPRGFCQGLLTVFEPPWPDLERVRLLLLASKESVAGVLDRKPVAGYPP